MIGLITTALAVLKVVLDFLLDIRKRQAEAVARVKRVENEQANVAEDIQKRRGKKLAQRARTMRLTVRELVRDPRLREDLRKARTGSKDVDQ